MDTKKGLAVMKEIKTANWRHVEDWKARQQETQNFFFTFGSDPRFPFGRDDYVVVEAVSMVQAGMLFQAVHPNRPGSDLLNCASVYTENQFAGIKEEYYKDVFPAEVISLRMIRMNTKEEKAPCPFCGEPISLIHEGFVDYWRFYCPNCDFSGSFGPGSASVKYGSKEEARKRAIQKWNKRR